MNSIQHIFNVIFVFSFTRTAQVPYLRLSITLVVLLTIYNLLYCGGAVIKHKKNAVVVSSIAKETKKYDHFFDKHNDDDFSPYFAAFSDRLRSELDEHEKLRNQLKYFHPMDWDEIAEVKAFESEDSDDWVSSV